MVKDFQRKCVKCGATSVFIELDYGWCPPCYKRKFITEKTNEQLKNFTAVLDLLQKVLDNQDTIFCKINDLQSNVEDIRERMITK